MAKKILIVDDEASIRESLSIGLRDLGWEPECADCAEAALSLSELFDAYVIDLSLPDYDGFKLVSGLEEQFGKIPVVLLSGYLTEDIKKEARSRGIDIIVKKPYRFEDVDKALRSVLGWPQEA